MDNLSFSLRVETLPRVSELNVTRTCNTHSIKYIRKLSVETLTNLIGSFEMKIFNSQGLVAIVFSTPAMGDSLSCSSAYSIIVYFVELSLATYDLSFLNQPQNSEFIPKLD